MDNNNPSDPNEKRHDLRHDNIRTVLCGEDRCLHHDGILRVRHQSHLLHYLPHPALIFHQFWHAIYLVCRIASVHHCENGEIPGSRPKQQ